MELFIQSEGFCVYGEDPCPRLLEHCYEVASEVLIGDWKADDRIEWSIAWQREKRRLHAAPHKHLPRVRTREWDSIVQENYLAWRPIFRLLGIGVDAFTFRRVAEVEVPGLKLTTRVDISGVKLSKNKLRCGLCGATWGKDDPRGLAHMLVAHGPLAGASPRKRKRVRAVLPAIFRRLEAAGFDELQAHQVIQIMAEELRMAGLV